MLFVATHGAGDRSHLATGNARLYLSEPKESVGFHAQKGHLSFLVVDEQIIDRTEVVLAVLALHLPAANVVGDVRDRLARVA